MNEIRYCQMETKEGTRECGFLCGSVCRANPNRPFTITGEFHRYISVVGCQSWQEYIDYGERRERFGQAALNGISGNTAAKGTESGTAASGRTVQVSGLQVQSKLETRGDDIGRSASSPMRVLQEGCTNELGEHPPLEQPAGPDLGTCSFCKEPAVAVDMGLKYCPLHGKKMGLIK